MGRSRSIKMASIGFVMPRTTLLLTYLTLALSAPRVIPLFHGHHFDDLMNDCQHDCPPVLIGFYSAQCTDQFRSLQFSINAPRRDELFMATYNVSSLQDVWFKPTEPTDLAARFGVNLSRSCPQLVLAPYREWSQTIRLSPEQHPKRDWKLWLKSRITESLSRAAERPARDRKITVGSSPAKIKIPVSDGLPS